MNTGKDLTKKIAKKKLNEVVELDEPKTTHTSGMFDDLEDDLFSNPLDESLGDGSFRKTRLKTYPWQHNPGATKTRVSERVIEETVEGRVPTTWRFASGHEADKSISRDAKCDEVVQAGVKSALRFAGADAEFHAVTTEELQELLRDAFMEGAHFRQENP